MKTLLLLLTLCCGCSVLRTVQTDTDGRVTRTTAWSFFDSHSELSKLAMSNTDKTQTLRVSGLNQETSGTNAVDLIARIVSAAVTAAK